MKGRDDAERLITDRLDEFKRLAGLTEGESDHVPGDTGARAKLLGKPSDPHPTEPAATVKSPSTSLAADAPQGAGSLRLVDRNGFEACMLIVIDESAETEEEVKLKDVNPKSDSVDLYWALRFQHSQGAVVKGIVGFMGVFFWQVNKIDATISRGRANVKTMGDVLDAALQATTPEQQKNLSDKLHTLVEKTNREVGAVKQMLTDMIHETDNLPDPEDVKICEGCGVYQVHTQRETHCCGHCSRGQGHGPNCERNPVPDEVNDRREIRINMQNQLTKKQYNLVVDFQKAQLDYKEALSQRQVKEIKMLMPELSEDDVRHKLEDRESLSKMVAQKMAGTHHTLIDEINRIQDKHQDILRLERSAGDLAQMFQEIAFLVDSQGEMLDAIEVHVHKAKVHTAKAEENLIQTRKAQHSAQKWMCCLAVFMLLLLLAILAPVLTSV